MLKYIGGEKGALYPGLPERDLEDRELAAFGGKDLLLGTELYDAVDDAVEAAIAAIVAEEDAEDEMVAGVEIEEDAPNAGSAPERSRKKRGRKA